MKKRILIFGVIIFAFSFAFSSCNTSGSVCPAYPPSVLQGDVQTQQDQDINNENSDNQIIELL
jgi:hypothetical protein